MWDSENNKDLQQAKPAFGFRWPIAVITTLLFCLASVTSIATASPQDDDEVFEDPRPLIDRDPFYRVTFTDDSSFLIEPIEIDNPKKLPKNGSLVFELLAEQSREFKYVVKWRNVKKIETFQDIIYRRAKSLEKKGKVTEAIRHYMFLKNHPMFEGNRIEIDFFPILVRDTRQTLKEKKFVEALACFRELKKTYPSRFLNLDNTIKSSDDGIRYCYDKILIEDLDAKKFRTVRRRIQQMKDLYPNVTKKLYDKYIERMREEARKGLSQLQKGLDSGKPLVAQDALRDMLAIAPDLPEAQDLKFKIQSKYPMIMVGVDQHSTTRDPRKMESWEARRGGIMVRRQLMEFQYQDDDGGVYFCPIGRFSSVGDEGLEYRLELNQNPNQDDVPQVSAIDVAFLMDQAVDPKSDSYQPLWARVLDSVSVENPTTVLIKFRYPFLLPKALLQMPFLDTKLGGSDGPLQFDFLDKKSDRYIYRPNSKYLSGKDRPRIVEKRIKDTSLATRLLIDGGIDVVDRVHPGELSRLQRTPGIVVRRYQIPSVHFLVPNFRNDWMSNPVFRRALLFGLDRKRIVKDVLTNGQDIHGYSVISGPFPVGVSETDPLMYANNFKIQPLPYNRHMARVFLKMAAKQVKGMEERRARMRGETRVVTPQATPDSEDINSTENNVDEEEEELPTPPVITLAHADNLQAESICTLIKQQWGNIGIKTKLVPLKNGNVMPKDDNYDFVFVECTMQEPLVEARRIFGRHGLVKTIDGNVEQSLDYIDRVKNWQSAGSGLRRLHTQVYNKTSILPLWQVPQYYAHRPNVRNLGFEINSLYQNVRSWRFDYGQIREESKPKP